MFHTSNLSYKRQKLSTCVLPLGLFFGGICVAHLFKFSVLSVLFFCFLLFCLSSACVLYVMCLVCHVSCMSCVLYVHCCQYHWIVHSWLSLRFSLTFIYYLLFVRCLVYQMVPVSLDYPFVITRSVFSNVYLINIGNIPVVYNII
jgi:hypothetical protein